MGSEYIILRPIVKGGEASDLERRPGQTESNHITRDAITGVIIISLGMYKILGGWSARSSVNSLLQVAGF
jgi:hypothetical protein